jgi:hypothetical protein
MTSSRIPSTILVALGNLEDISKKKHLPQVNWFLHQSED